MNIPLFTHLYRYDTFIHIDGIDITMDMDVDLDNGYGVHVHVDEHVYNCTYADVEHCTFVHV